MPVKKKGQAHSQQVTELPSIPAISSADRKEKKESIHPQPIPDPPPPRKKERMTEDGQ